jgi:hypothetical protein
MGRQQRPYVEMRGSGEYPWRVRWPTPQRTASGEIRYEQASGFATGDEAMDYGWEQLAKIRSGKWTDPRGARTPLGEWAAKVMEQVSQAPVTAAKRRRFLRLHILPEFGHVPIGEINRWAVRVWASKIRLTQDSVQQVVSTLSYFLTAAAEAGLIDANPIYKMPLSFAGQQQAQSLAQDEERVWAFPEQAVPIAARMRRADALMVLTAGFVGNRFGELAGLHMDNCCLVRRDEIGGRVRVRHVIRVDPETGALHETSEIDAKGKERTKLYLGPPKPPNGAREVDVPEFLARMLIAHTADVRRRAEDLDQDDPARGIVFTALRGGLWSRSNWMRVMRPACDGREANPPRQGTRGWPAWDPVVPGLNLRGLRIGHKTAMVEDEVAPVLQDQVMGHGPKRKQQQKDIGKRYTEITPVMRWKRLDALAARWERAGGIDLDFAA